MTCLRSTCVLLLALTSGAFAQTATSVIFGSATDASGAAIPNVAVTATATATGVSIKVVTNESGNYIFPNLQPGTYTVSCEAPGFRKAEVGNVLVEVNQRGRVDLAMQVGEVREVVAVQANVTTVDTFSPTVKEGGGLRPCPRTAAEWTPDAAIAIAAAGRGQCGVGFGRVADRHQYGAECRGQRDEGELVVLHGFEVKRNFNNAATPGCLNSVFELRRFAVAHNLTSLSKERIGGCLSAWKRVPALLPRADQVRNHCRYRHGSGWLCSRGRGCGRYQPRNQYRLQNQDYRCRPVRRSLSAARCTRFP